MLPSTKRLSRSEFTLFLNSPEIKTVFNPLGTLKYKDSQKPKVSIVISSKYEKRAVYRNKLRRRLYSLFGQHIKDFCGTSEYILYTSKQAPKMEYTQINLFLNELLKKTTK